MRSCENPRRACGPAGQTLVGQGRNLPHVTQGLSHGVAGAGTRLQADGVVCALRLSVPSCTARARQGSQSERMPGGGSARAILDAQTPSLPPPAGTHAPRPLNAPAHRWQPESPSSFTATPPRWPAAPSAPASRDALPARGKCASAPFSPRRPACGCARSCLPPSPTPSCPCDDCAPSRS
jgi:hypothetical protein